MAAGAVAEPIQVRIEQRRMANRVHVVGEADEKAQFFGGIEQRHQCAFGIGEWALAFVTRNESFVDRFIDVADVVM